MSSTEGNPVQRLRSTLMENLPYCSGTLEVSPRDLVLYYGRGIQTTRIGLAQATTDQLDALQSACESAPFGRGDQTMLDEGYRKAGKMEVDNFMIGFDAERAGLTEVVRSFLFHGIEEEKFVRAELYELNVYGKGAFFKPHKDTPRAENMFGSLVVVLPTPHEGGAFVLRHDESQWTFDSGEVLAEPGAVPRIAFVSFFSDVEHQVLPVTSGHRLTITYNLYFSTTGAQTSTLSGALAALLADPIILPEGGTLGFGLQHQYPFPKSWTYGDANPLAALRGRLKGSDGALFHACAEQGLAPLLRLVLEYDMGRHTIVPILLEKVIELDEYDLEEEEPFEVICDDRGGTLLFCRSLLDGSVPTKTRQSYWGYGWRPPERDRYIQRIEDLNPTGHELIAKKHRGLPRRRVNMVTDVTRFNALKSMMVVHMGRNNAGLSHMYQYVFLMVDIGPAGRRRETRWQKGEDRSWVDRWL